MSLLDTIRCDYPLPDPEFQKEKFQTRDLGERMNHYRITADGRLMRRSRRGFLFSRNEPEADDTETLVDTHHHGDIILHTSTPKGLLVYRVRFTHGMVEWIRRAGDHETLPDSPDRLATDVEHLQMHYWMRLEEFLRRLEALDPELANRAIEVWDDRADAALWLATVHPALKTTPYRALAVGKRQAVLDLLARFQHGIPG